MKINKKGLKQMIQEALNKSKWQLLNETTLNRILGKYFEDGFIIITSERTCKAEKGEDCTQQEAEEQAHQNNKNMAALQSLIRSSGYGYVPTLGGYKERVVDKETGKETVVDTGTPEESLVVVARPDKGLDHTHLMQLGVELAKDFNQDSFLYKPATADDTKAYYITQDGSVDLEFSDVSPNDLAQEYYTQLRKRRQERFSFTENMIFELRIPKPPASTSEARKRYREHFYRLQ